MAAAHTDPVTPLWRAAQLFRLLSFLYALGFQIAITDDLTRPGLGWTLFTVLTVANLLWAVGYLAGWGRNRYAVIGELAVATAAILSTPLVAGSDWIAANQSWPTTLWAANAVLSAGLLWGAAAGLVSGLWIAAVNFVYKGEIAWDVGRNATAILLLVTGVAVGTAATTARRSAETLTAATELAARTAERERLSAEVHDTVLQVLALISRRGREIGGETTELADLAAEQERRLRRLISAGSDPVPATGTVDLAARLRELDGPAVSVSTPGHPVPLPAATAAGLLAAVGNALDNVDRHAGPAARAFILLEQLPGETVVSVRDDGPGIPPGRLAAAAAEGRLGIAASIVGRIEALGGTAVLDSAPGRGTEWELTVPTGGEHR